MVRSLICRKQELFINSLIQMGHKIFITAIDKKSIWSIFRPIYRLKKFSRDMAKLIEEDLIQMHKKML